MTKTHGMSGTPEYMAFQSARDRCRNPKNISYPRYGGRGIEFRFGSFEEWFNELGLRPDSDMNRMKYRWSVDRIDNDGHYEPGNVRWATTGTQHRTPPKLLTRDEEREMRRVEAAESREIIYDFDEDFEPSPKISPRQVLGSWLPYRHGDHGL